MKSQMPLKYIGGWKGRSKSVGAVSWRRHGVSGASPWPESSHCLEDAQGPADITHSLGLFLLAPPEWLATFSSLCSSGEPRSDTAKAENEKQLAEQDIYLGIPERAEDR